MLRTLLFAVSALLLAASPALAGTLQVYENSLGSPGVTAIYGIGLSLNADLDLDASTAEGGSLSQGATEITFVPTGSVSFTSFACEAVDCIFNFTAGGAGTGFLSVSDGDIFSQSGVTNIGQLGFDGAGLGTINLTTCNYTDGNTTEQTCSPFTVAQVVPEPGTGLLVLAGLGMLAGPLRRRRA